MTPQLAILYQDDHYVAVDKPAGLLVHRSRIAADAGEFLLQKLRNQLRRWVYPVHRLDRPTSGIIIFATDSAAAQRLVALFEKRRVRKRYLGIVRGYAEEEGMIDHPVKDEHDGSSRPGITRYRCLAKVELPISDGRFPSSRYSLVELTPETGRRHQLRYHLKHISHPLIGDTTYGKGPHNRLFGSRYGVNRLLLHAESLQFDHPYSAEEVRISAPFDSDWNLLLREFGWDGLEKPFGSPR